MKFKESIFRLFCFLLVAGLVGISSSESACAQWGGVQEVAFSVTGEAEYRFGEDLWAKESEALNAAMENLDDLIYSYQQAGYMVAFCTDIEIEWNSYPMQGTQNHHVIEVKITGTLHLISGPGF
jgi:hypothetical protein